MEKTVGIFFATLLIFFPLSAYADDMKIEQICEKDSFVITITDLETDEPVQNVNVYTLTTKRNIVEKFTTDGNGTSIIPKDQMTGMIKLSKGGYNDQTVGSQCFETWESERAGDDREKWTSYGSHYEEKSQEDLIVFCDNNYEMYQLLGPEEFQKMFTDSMSIIYTSKCIKLYNSPVWTYEGEDRVKVLNDWLAQTSYQGTPPEQVQTTQTIEDEDTSSSLIDKLKERIESLEQQLVEKDEQIEKKDALLMEQLRVIQQLAASFTNTFFEPMSRYFGFA
jgi:hypothetical protein